MLLITRPIAQTKNLESLLLANEIDFALFPTFEIKKLKPIFHTHQYDVIIFISVNAVNYTCLLYTSPSPRDGLLSRMPSSA